MRIGSESVLAENPPFYVDQSLPIERQHHARVHPARMASRRSAPLTIDLTRTTIHAQDPNQRTPYVQQVSFGPQIEFSQSTVLDVSYVGNFGRKENRLRNANQGFVTGFTPAGTAITTFLSPT